ncbi:MAG: methyltransferase domain-containing protein [Acidobacteriota bacterium]
MPLENLCDSSLVDPTLPSHARAQELFDRTADHYQARSELKVSSFSSLIFQRRIEIVLRFLDRIESPGRVLDYGMGPAVFGRACVDRGLGYLGIDISPVMVQHARDMNLRAAEYEVGDLRSLGNYRNQMDGVLAIGLLDYLEKPWDGIAALSDCVKPGGVLVLSFRNRYSVPRILRDVAKVFAHPFRRQTDRRAFFSPVHERSFDSASELVPALRKMNYHQVETAYFNCSPLFFDFPMQPRLWERWRQWDGAVASPRTSFLCSGGVVIARKQP